ncbi:hypothetical protein LB507_001495 [Fusarium sp. FIESC RH6]|nr:hypothetical protein LB507_001495 [Fusarium sp. FIESC RH6]
MAREDLCHPCYRRRLAIMQSSQYSIYNEYYKEQLERVYKTCGGSGPTDIPPPLIPEEKEPAFCFKNKWYTTKEGDTCDSISKDKGVSGALLYMGNQDVIDDCHNIPKGLEVCIPTSCKTYYVKPEDTCFSIEMALNLRPRYIRRYNSWIDRDCNKLQGGTDFWGKSICVSPLGDAKTLEAIKKTSSNQRVFSSGNAPSVLRTLPPEEAEVAKGTTLQCGSWHVVKKSDTCNDLCEDNSACDLGLLYKANPSLDMKKCLESLVPGTALCVAPISGWDAKN